MILLDILPRISLLEDSIFSAYQL